MQKVLRTLKDGGQSLCCAPDEKVGKGRCRHVLGEGSDIKVNVNKKERCVYININDSDSNESVSVKAKEEKVTKFISELSKGLPKKQADAILDHLRN